MRTDEDDPGPGCGGSIDRCFDGEFLVSTSRAEKREDLRQRLARLPRCRFSQFPTPLEHCGRLSKALGGPDIFMKRDDLTSLAFGGNKSRLIEFIFGEIVGKGFDTLVAGAYTQSNWCRQVTAAACRLGFDVELVLIRGEKGEALQGNLLLDRLMGAGVTIVDIQSSEDLAPLLRNKADELRAAGRNPFVLEPFSELVLTRGAASYVDAAIEIDEQSEALGLSIDHLYLSGANMTPAGLQLGFRAIDSTTRVVSVDPIKWNEHRAPAVARLANAAAELLDLPTRFEPADITNYDNYIGPGYGVVSDAGLEAMKLVASMEGIILDPVYTSKAMAALIHDARSGKLTTKETVVFLHTGGTPALFAYADDLDLQLTTPAP